MAKHKRHEPYFNKKLGKQVCDKCGLIYLRNERTAKAIRKQCPGKEDDHD